MALCYGWIDSQRKSYDEHSFLQRYSRRRRNSPWSQVNVDHVEALSAAGRMRPPGLAEVAAAQADGRWAAAYTAQRNATVPPDLAEALAARPEAAARFAGLDKTGRYLVILPLLKARTPAGRAVRLRKAISGLLD
ncbi:YdeI family protein [Streptosporangium lutulentum]